MDRRMCIDTERQRLMFSEIRAALKKAGITGAIAEVLTAQWAARAYVRLETGEILFDVMTPHISDNARSGWNVAEWRFGKPVPTPLVEALRLLTDKDGPEVVLARRDLSERRAFWDAETRSADDILEMHRKQRRDVAEMRLQEAWRALSAWDRACAHHAHRHGADAPFTIAKLQPLLDAEHAGGTVPPPGWVAPPPPPPPHQQQMPNVTFRPSTKRAPTDHGYYTVDGKSLQKTFFDVNGTKLPFDPRGKTVTWNSDEPEPVSPLGPWTDEQGGADDDAAAGTVRRTF